MKSKIFGKVRRKIRKIRSFLMLVAALMIFIIGGLFLWVSTFKIPTLDSFNERKVSQSTKIYDKTGQVLLYDVFQNVKRTVVPFDKISPFVKSATLAIEDAKFYDHGGIKITSIIRAVIANFTTLSFSQGGSTITQQVVKNSLLSGDKTISRKLKEWVLSIKLEKVLSKDEIFSMYLNEIPYGGNIYGIEEASQAFFGKTSSDLTLAESAYLASLPKAPTYYSPYGKNKAELEKRKDLVLKEMLKNNFINEKQYNEAKNERVTFVPQEEENIKAPHFVMFVKDYIEKKYGTEALTEGGLKITTTLDYEIQKKAEELTKKYALENKEKFNAENAAMVIIDPKTGGILAMVGSRNYFDKEIDGNFNVATAPNRQPGSTFKPFAYAAAFNKGYTPETVLFDLKTEFSTECDETGKPKSEGAVCYMPQNYDLKYRGPITMRNALAQSVNIPSIKTLYLAGMKETLRLARDMGVQSLTDVNKYGLTLVLGGGEVSLLDMTSAYSVFANNGEKNPYTPIIEIKNKDGTTLESMNVQPTRVLSEITTAEINDILSDNNARTPAFGERSLLYIPDKDVAVKTGTTNDYRDAWIIGYTPRIVVGAWVGNNDNRPMEKKVAGFIVAPLWNDMMTNVLKNIPDERFTAPKEEDWRDLKPVLRGKWEGGISYFLDKVSGKQATEYTPSSLLDEKLGGGIHTILYWVEKDNPRGEIPTNPEQDSQFKNWEYAVRKWVEEQGIIENINPTLPKDFDNVHTSENIPEVKIISPLDKTQVKVGSKINIEISYKSKFALKKAEYYVDDNFIGDSEMYPYNLSFASNKDDLGVGQHQIKVIVYDTILNKGETTSLFDVVE